LSKNATAHKENSYYTLAISYCTFCAGRHTILGPGYSARIVSESISWRQHAATYGAYSDCQYLLTRMTRQPELYPSILPPSAPVSRSFALSPHPSTGPLFTNVNLTAFLPRRFDLSSRKKTCALLIKITKD